VRRQREEEKKNSLLMKGRIAWKKKRGRGRYPSWWDWSGCDEHNWPSYTSGLNNNTIPCSADYYVLLYIYILRKLIYCCYRVSLLGLIKWDQQVNY
jgi:hypothetical protein